jgi:hypothetical protein
MNLRLIGSTAGAVLLASILGACDAQQQDPQCMVGKGAFATVYTLEEGEDASLACAQLKPEPVGLEKYFSKEPGGPASVALRPKTVGDLVAETKATTPKIQLDPDAPFEPDSVGALTTDAPGADNFCEVPALNPTTQVVTRAIAADGKARNVSYEWSNLRIYNTPQIPGTQFVANLRYSNNGCTAKYKVKGIWPVVDCSREIDADADGDGKKDKVPDESKCDPNPDPKVGRTRGSGINPIFPVKCDPDVKICVLTGEVPSDRP